MKFSGDAIEVFLFILVNLGKDGVFMLDNIFNGYEVIECEVCAGFTRAICSDGVVQDIGGFDGRGEMGIDKGVKMRVQSLED